MSLRVLRTGVAIWGPAIVGAVLVVLTGIGYTLSRAVREGAVMAPSAPVVASPPQASPSVEDHSSLTRRAPPADSTPHPATRGIGRAPEEAPRAASPARHVQKQEGDPGPRPQTAPSAASAPPTVESRPPTASRVAEAVEAELKSLADGKIAHNLPDEMALDEVREVEARITRRLDDPTLVRGLLGGTSVEVLDVKVGSVMKLELVGDPEAFGITRIASPVQAVVESRHTRWIWTVRAKRAGSHPLVLRASVRIPVPEHGKDATHDIVVYTAKVRVLVSPWRLVRDFTGANWQWLAGTLLIPGVAWVIRGRRRQTEPPAPKASE
jgi:hypothetical protein